MNLSPGQIILIQSIVDQSQISTPTLKDDVLDHLCCLVEDRMDCGETFETSLQEGLQQLAPKGLDAIQYETDFLLNANKILPMKKIMYSIGLASTMAMCMGATMNILHLPGAGNLSDLGIGTYGFLVFAFIFIPMVAFNHFKTNPRNVLSEKMKIISGCVSGMIVALAVVFKVLHLPGADQLMMAGAILFTFGFLPFHFFTMYRKSVGRVAQNGQ